MSKLFALESDEIGNDEIEPINLEPVSISEEIEDHSDTFNIVTEALKSSSAQLLTVSNIRSSLNGKNRSTVDYFTSLENYTPFIQNIQKNLGVKKAIPSLEDFHSPSGAEACHRVAMEGLFDYVKKIWEKIKEVFKAFFKKISLFFRRLVNANLDLEEYEVYVKKMMSDIKSNKKKFNDDTSPIDSKLPSLLATEGLEKVDVNYIQNAGVSKMRRLTHLTNEIFIDDVNYLANKALKALKDDVKELSKLAMVKEFNLDEIKDTISELMDNTVESLRGIHSVQINDIKSLPEKVYGDISYHFDREEMDGLEVYAVTDVKDSYNQLPKNYNSFLAVSKNSNLFIGASTESNGYVIDKLEPVLMDSILSRLYDEYIKFSKGVDISKLAKNVNSLDNDINDVIKAMSGSFTDALEVLQDKAQNSGKTPLERLTLAVDMLILYQSKRVAAASTDGMSEDEWIGDALRGVQKLFPEIDPEIAMGTHKQENIGDLNVQIIGTFMHNEEEAISRIEKYVGQKVNDYDPTSDVDMYKDAIKEFEKIQKFMLNYLNNVQVLLRDISLNLAGTYMEVRYEMIKYIYNAGKRFS